MDKTVCSTVLLAGTDCSVFISFFYGELELNVPDR